jgi:hypothetical protein
MSDLDAASPDDLKAQYVKRDFLQSFLLTQIGDHLKGLPTNVAGRAASNNGKGRKSKRARK